MKIENLKLLYFSPTNTTKAIMQSIAKNIEYQNMEDINLTLVENQSDELKADKNDLVVFGAPVYSGRISPVAKERLMKIKGNNTPAVIVVLYGNREFEDALVELKDIVEELGFKTIAGAAFIGEHSYSTDERPIAKSRPDKDDLEVAMDFGKKIMTWINKYDISDDAVTVMIPGNKPYKERKTGLKIDPPVTDEEKCIQCFECVNACPVNAIDAKDPTKTRGKICIHCCACIKICPEQARKFEDPMINNITQWLYDNFTKRKEPQIFI